MEANRKKTIGHRIYETEDTLQMASHGGHLLAEDDSVCSLTAINVLRRTFS